EVLISPKPGLMFWQSGWKRLAVSRQSIDLTKYVGKDSAPVFRGRVDAGSFDAIHLKLKEASGVLHKKSQRNVQIKNLVGPIKLGFEIRSQDETLIVLDLVVLDMSAIQTLPRSSARLVFLPLRSTREKSGTEP